jgi:hypothetical protein
MIGAMCRVNVHEIIRFALNDRWEGNIQAKSAWFVTDM